MRTSNRNRTLRRLSADFWRHRLGGALIEFAFVLPLLVMCVAAVIEFGTIVFVDSLLEGSVRQASRFGITGYAPAGVSRQDQITQTILEGTAGLVQPADLTITTLVYSNSGSIGQPEPFVDANGNGAYDGGESFSDTNGNGTWDADMGVAGAGGPGDVVVYTATVRWRLMTHLLDSVIGDPITLAASTTVRNEPWGAAP
jgi:Flp pilus assembly protein TadG